MLQFQARVNDKGNGDVLVRDARCLAPAEGRVIEARVGEDHRKGNADERPDRDADQAQDH